MGAQESKLSFRRGVFRLHEERNIPTDDPYWSNYWTLPESAEDIFTLFSTSDIRKTRDEAPENFETLMLVMCRRMFQLRCDHRFPSAEAPETHMLNCLRVLTRLIPFAFEDEAFEKETLRFMWASDETSDESAQEDTKSWGTRPVGLKTSPIAEDLIKTLIDLLFFCGFTIPSSYGQEKVVYGIWETGVGCTVPMGTTKQFESNKIETLRCILALTSRGMYRPANELRDNRHVTHLVMMIPKNIVLALLCSLINTTMKFNPTTWRTIPYSSSFLSDPRQLLATYSLQFLLIVLCYPLPKEGSQIYAGQIPDGETGPVNSFRHYFKKLHRANDFNFMVEGMSRVLQQPLSASSTYLPGSQRPVRFHPEMLLLFWESLQQNRRFKTFLIETDRALDFLVVLLFYALNHKTDPSQIGLVRMCVFILQPLSAEAKFASRLNKTFEGQASLPPAIRIPSFSGTYADFLIINIYNLIATSKGQLVSLYSALFMTLSNIAPHVTELSVVASTKLVQLFTSISQPSFLFANDSNFKLLQYMLEVINGIIEHNFNANPHLIYAILRSHTKFEALQDLTLNSGIETIQRLRKIKEEREIRAREDDEDKTPRDENVPSLEQGTPTNARSDPFSKQTQFVASDGESGENEPSRTGNSSSATQPTKSHSKTPSLASISRKSSVSSEMDYPPPSPRVMSEKARGKLPEGAILHRQNSASSMISSLGSSNTHMGSASEFNPSGPWFEAWYPDLEMGPVKAVLDQLAAEVMKLSEETPDPRPIIRHLQKAKISGIYPRTPNPRTFVWSEQAKVWFESLLFGYIYLSETQIGNGAVGVWTGTNVKLFRVQSDPAAEDPNLIFRIGSSVDAMANTFAQKFNVGATNPANEATVAITQAPQQ